MNAAASPTRINSASDILRRRCLYSSISSGVGSASWPGKSAGFDAWDMTRRGCGGNLKSVLAACIRAYYNIFVVCSPCVQRCEPITVILAIAVLLGILYNRRAIPYDCEQFKGIRRRLSDRVVSDTSAAGTVGWTHPNRDAALCVQSIPVSVRPLLLRSDVLYLGIKHKDERN